MFAYNDFMILLFSRLTVLLNIVFVIFMFSVRLIHNWKIGLKHKL